MDTDYWEKTQRSFVTMADDEYVYRDEHPVNWCPRCQTAIADAEVENEDREGTLYDVTFPGVDGDAAAVFATIEAAFEAAGEQVGHVVTTATVSANSPSNSKGGTDHE